LPLDNLTDDDLGGAVTDPRLIEALERMVERAVGLTTVALGECMPAAELTLPQWRTLVVVVQADGARIGEIGGRVGIGLSSASRLVQRLERRGLVATERDEADRRGTIARPTTRGIQLWEHLVDYRRRVIAQLLDELPSPLPPELADGVLQVERAFARYA
jgi:DNA-binding MarR family transcriptional regulator